MTRDEAVEFVRHQFSFCKVPNTPVANQWVDIFERLGMLKLDAPLSAASHVDVVDYLTNIFVEVHGEYQSPMYFRNAKTTRSGAIEILDVLSKHGFVIMKQPNV